MGNSELDQALHESVLKRQAYIDEKKAKEDIDRRAKYEAESALFGAGTLTKKKIIDILNQNRRMYYRTEELNDKLYLHFGGFRKLENLEKFTGVKALYAESNALESMVGIEAMIKLRTLCMHQNCITEITGLENHPDLWSLNLSENFIERIDQMEQCKNLNTLNISGNRIGFKGLDDVRNLIGTSICCLDIQNNKIDDPEVIDEILLQMPHLNVLYLKGNPVCSKIKNYRKTIISRLPKLSYLDDRPVFKDERRYCEAFIRGGIEEEREERKKFQQEEREKRELSHRRFQEMIETARREKREREAMSSDDKYNNENQDPVRPIEEKMAERKAAWMEEHKDELKDDAKEAALKKLKSEKEERLRKEAELTEEEREAARLQVKEQKQKEMEELKKTVDSKKEKDNRKLVYDDIWDEGEIKPMTKENYRPTFAPPSRVTRKPQESTPSTTSGSTSPKGSDLSGQTEKVVLSAEEQECINELSQEPKKTESVKADADEKRAPTPETRPSTSGSAWSLKIQGADENENNIKKPATPSDEVQNLINELDEMD